MHQWKSDFEGLYNPVHIKNFDTNHLVMIEPTIPQPPVMESNYLDQTISLAEV